MTGLLESMGLKPILGAGGGGDGVALTSAAHPPGALEQMAKAIKDGRLAVRWLQCNACGHRLDDETVGPPLCAKCGARMHVYSRPA